MKYYLLDFENVNTAGLDGIGELPPDSRIVLFYTKNSNKIDLGVVGPLRDMQADLMIIEVQHGKQALDIQLASYLGYLIGTEPEDTEYYIISKDKGYRNVMSFWPDRHIVLCKNLFADSDVLAEPQEEKKPASRSGSRGGRKSGPAKTAKPAAKTEPKSKPKAEPKIVSEPKPNAFAEAAAIAKAVVEANKARDEADQKKNAKPKQKASDTRSEINNEIQKVLSKEGFSGDVVNATASFVSKNIGKDGYKQTIYRGIIKENGQKQGLAIYRLIKDIL